MVLGLIGTLLPVLPGLLLMWGAAVVYGLVTGLDAVAWIALGLISAVAVGSAWLSVRIPATRTASAGVGVGSQALALVLAAIGFFVLPVVGAAVGFVFGIFMTRLAATRDRGQAWEATKAALVALWQAAAVQFGAGVLVLLIWVVWLLTGS